MTLAERVLDVLPCVDAGPNEATDEDVREALQEVDVQ